MAKKVKKGLVTKKAAPSNQLVIQEINIQAPDRSRKDISDFKSALESAERTEYPQRVQLYNLYEDIILDGHLSGIMAKRISAVLNKKLRYVNASGKRVDEFDNIIKSTCFRNIVTDIMQSKFWGVSGLEFVIHQELKYYRIPRKHIKPEKKFIAKEQYDDSGIPYEGLWNMWIVGEEKDFGLLLKCAPYALMKRGAMADWSQYIEIFGQPVRVVYYDAYDEKTKIELKQVLDESGSALALMIPKQAQFEMKDGKQSNGTGELQEKFKKALDDEMSVIILGATETTTSSKSSGYAQSETHGKQQLEVTKDDLQFVANMLNDEHFIRILKSYALPVMEGGMFEFEREIDLAELNERIKIDKEVVMSLKTPIDDDYVYETYGIPKPKNYDELKKKQEEMANPIPPAPAPGKPAPGKPATAKKKTVPDQASQEAQDFLTWLRTQLADFFDPAP